MCGSQALFLEMTEENCKRMSGPGPKLRGVEERSQSLSLAFFFLRAANA